MTRRHFQLMLSVKPGRSKHANYSRAAKSPLVLNEFKLMPKPFRATETIRSLTEN